MDSMRSLNTSLPRSSPRQPRSHPPGELLSAFKAAALSVTQLYKTAAADEDGVRAAGYQDAIDELLKFLDQEDIGLGDGEGWRIRQWATERLSPSAYNNPEENDDQRDASTEAPTQGNDQTSLAEENRQQSAKTDHIPFSRDSIHHTTEHSSEAPPPTEPRQEVFHFRSSSMPAAYISNDTDMDNTPDHQPAPAMRTMHLPRQSIRANISRGQGSNMQGPRMLGRGAGVKRKPSFPDVFDLSSFMGFDGSKGGVGGGGKRSRFA